MYYKTMFLTAGLLGVVAGLVINLGMRSFKVGDCLISKENEVWEEAIVSKVIKVGRENYLIETPDYQGDPSFTNSYTTKMNFASAESNFYVVKCPDYMENR